MKTRNVIKPGVFVETLVVPQTLIQPPVGSIGQVVGTQGPYWMIEFMKPFSDGEIIFLWDEERPSVGVGYLPTEIKKVSATVLQPLARENEREDTSV